MKRWMDILRIAFVVVLVAGTIVLVSFVESEQSDILCKQVYITMDYGKSDVLVTRSDIDSLLRRTSGNLKGKPVRWINTGRIEEAILRQPYVASAKVYGSHQGYLFVEVTQRQPVLRIINQTMESCYLDISGRLLPLNPGYPARVPVATGAIAHSLFRSPDYRVDVAMRQDKPGSDSLMGDLYRMAMYISHNRFFKAQITQIHVTPQQEFELIPGIGHHIILFGTATEMEEKFRKLFIFYTQGLTKTGWNKYKVINLKYANQVVCSKN